MSKFAHLELELFWESLTARHHDVFHFPTVDLDQDRLEECLTVKLRGAVSCARAQFAAGTLVPPHRQDNVLACTLPLAKASLLRRGRYYPRAWFGEALRHVSEDQKFCQVIDLRNQHVIVDLNHPLASFQLELRARMVQSPPAQVVVPVGRDLVACLTDGGAGRQAAGEVDFGLSEDMPLARSNVLNDALFYDFPRLVYHLDATARAQVTACYDGLLQPGFKVLDLMASWVSHLPNKDNLKVAGLGMNKEELDANPVLDQRHVHDLNRTLCLPFDDQQFDVVICTVSVEYLTWPVQIFREVCRVLRPGGIFVNTFSDRWFPPKVVAVWTELTSFERLGLVANYYQRAGGYEHLRTHSVRGLPRPRDDEYAAQLPYSDAIYAIWARRQS